MSLVIRVKVGVTVPANHCQLNTACGPGPLSAQQVMLSLSSDGLYCFPRIGTHVDRCVRVIHLLLSYKYFSFEPAFAHGLGLFQLYILWWREACDSGVVWSKMGLAIRG